MNVYSLKHDNDWEYNVYDLWRSEPCGGVMLPSEVRDSIIKLSGEPSLRGLNRAWRHNFDRHVMSLWFDLFKSPKMKEIQDAYEKKLRAEHPDWPEYLPQRLEWKPCREKFVLLFQWMKEVYEAKNAPSLLSRLTQVFRKNKEVPKFCFPKFTVNAVKEALFEAYTDSLSRLVPKLLMGQAGKFDLGLGIKVSMEGHKDVLQGSNPIDRFSLFKLASYLQQSKAFQLATQGYLRVFVHEMGHALTHRMLYSDSKSIEINVGVTGSATSHRHQTDYEFKYSIELAAGPLFDASLSNLELFVTNKLSGHLPGLVTGALAARSLVWISGEVIYALASVLDEKKSGDFGQIWKADPKYFCVATAALMAQFGLAVFQTYSMFS